jgi:hypothetical protein
MQQAIRLREQRGEQKDTVRRQQPEDSRLPDAARNSESTLTREEQKQVEALKKRDGEVRQHEQAHKAAGGPYVIGGPYYSFRRGPDGKLYAVGGEVQIDASPVPNDPEATLRKAQIVRRAALAPKEPSVQDRRVAAQASAVEKQARAELRQKQREEEREDESTVNNANTPESDASSMITIDLRV